MIFFLDQCPLKCLHGFGHYAGIDLGLTYIFLEVKSSCTETSQSQLQAFASLSALSEPFYQGIQKPLGPLHPLCGRQVDRSAASGSCLHQWSITASAACSMRLYVALLSRGIKPSKPSLDIADTITRRQNLRCRFACRSLRRAPRVCACGRMIKAGLNCDGMKQRLS